MSLLFGKRRDVTAPTAVAGAEERSGIADWRDIVFNRRPTGTMPVTNERLLTHSMVYSCVDLLADIVSGFPLDRYKDNPLPEFGPERVEGGADMVEDPSSEDIMDAVNWRRLVVVMWLMRGFAPGIVTGINNRYPHIPSGIELIHPDRVGFIRDRPDAPWRYMLDEKEEQLWPRGRLWIANGKMLNPADPVGRSILEFAAVEAQLGMYARQFASDFFQGGGHPTAILKNDKKVSDMGLEEEGAKRVKQRFMDALNGSREPVVMTDGWAYERIQIRPDESQFLATINANRLIVCNYFRVPPQIFGISPMETSGAITYANAADRGLDMMKFTISPWVKRMELVLNPLTLKNEYVKLDIDDLLRADTKRRYESHGLAIRSGWQSINEVREIEDLPPI